MLIGNGGASPLPAIPKIVTGSFHASPSVQAAFKPPKPIAAPSVVGSQIDNPGGGGGYALQSTQNTVTDQHNANPAPFDPSTDAGVAAALNAQTKGNADIGTLLGQGLSSLFINYGSPSLAAALEKYGYSLTPNDTAAAQANYNAGTATAARIDQAHTLGRQAAINALAAHGIADSGDLGYKVGQQDQAYANTLSDAQQAALNQAFSLQQNALSQRQQLLNQVTNAYVQAANNFAQNPGLYTQQPEPYTTGSATPPSPTVTAPPPTPKAAAAPKAKPAAKTLVNPYVTGQKARG